MFPLLKVSWRCRGKCSSAHLDDKSLKEFHYIAYALPKELIINVSCRSSSHLVWCKGVWVPSAHGGTNLHVPKTVAYCADRMAGTGFCVCASDTPGCGVGFEVGLRVGVENHLS